MTVPTRKEILDALRVPPETKVIVDRNGRPNNQKVQREPRVVINRFKNLLAKEN